MLIINGSPRGTSGATWWVLERFIKGVEAAGKKAEIVNLASKKIHHCTGEWSCWFKTPGVCIHSDDMEGILKSVESAESLVLATPVYVDGMSGLLKNCLDRMIPIADPHFELRDGHLRHPTKKSAIKNIALVSVCGFTELDNFDPLLMHVKAICRNMNAAFAGAVLRPAAPMLPYIPTIHPLFFKLRSLSKAIERAGGEFARTGHISEEVQTAVSVEIISKERYFKEANKHFDEIVKT